MAPSAFNAVLRLLFLSCICAAAAGCGGSPGVAPPEAARLSYFLEPVTAYEPRFATSWTMRVATAVGPTPAALASAPEAVLGTATTAVAYGVHARLTALAPQLSDCGLWNNPAIAYEGERLYLIAECLAFDGMLVSQARSRMVCSAPIRAGRLRPGAGSTPG